MFIGSFVTQWGVGVVVDSARNELRRRRHRRPDAFALVLPLEICGPYRSPFR